MKSIGILGISLHDHEASDLARFTLPREERASKLSALAANLGANELVYLATCNRVEFLFRSDAPARAGELADRIGAAFAAPAGPPPAAPFRLWSGEEAAEHLFQVAAGLDSAVLGERDIQGQIRDALAAAREAATCGEALERIVDEALRAARQVHLRTQLGAGRISLAEIACEAILDRVRRSAPADGEGSGEVVALVGVSAMTRRAAEILRRERVPFVLVNRTVARAEELVAALAAGRAQSLDDFRRRPPRVEAILCATGSSEPVLDRAALERLAARSASQEAPLVVDLAIPPDVDPETARAAQVPRLGIDEITGSAIERRQSRRNEADAARRVIAEALAGMKRRLAERSLAPVITRIHRRYRDTALEGIERLLAGHGLELEAAAREDLERWAEILARRFAHLPARGLRGLAAEHGLAAVRTFLASCDGGSFADLCAELAEIDAPEEDCVPERDADSRPHGPPADRSSRKPD
jgi:glutamyl-tRNA reductase